MGLSVPVTPVDVVADVASVAAEAIKLTEQNNAENNTPAMVAAREAALLQAQEDAMKKAIASGDLKTEQEAVS